MRVLFDECLPRKLKREFSDFDVSTVLEKGWGGKKNGELLRLAQSEFDVFVTNDHGITYQQNLKNVQIAIITLKTQNNRLESLLPLVSQVKLALETIQKGEIIQIS